MKAVVLLITLALFAAPLWAETYVWEDDQGTVNFSEDLGKVPKNLRNKARIVGEEEEPSQPEPSALKGKELPQPKGQGEDAVKKKEKEKVSPAPADIRKTMYGDKDGAAWRAEYRQLDADLKANERQLEEFQDRLQTPEKLSRSEYLSIQHSMKSVNYTVNNLRNKLETVRQQAEAAGVPAELMQ